MLSVTFADDATERGRAFGIFGAISGAGGALGLLLGGVLTQDLSWRWCLYVNLIIAAVAFAGALVFLRDGGRPERTRIDISGTITAVLGLVGIVYGLGNAESKLPGSVAGPLTSEDLATYRKPYPTRDSRLPLLRWARSMPLGEEPADIVARIDRYDEWLMASAGVPKLLLSFQPGPARGR
jgi:MFS family permease